MLERGERRMLVRMLSIAISSSITIRGEEGVQSQELWVLRDSRFSEFDKALFRLDLSMMLAVEVGIVGRGEVRRDGDQG